MNKLSCISKPNKFRILLEKKMSSLIFKCIFLFFIIYLAINLYCKNLRDSLENLEEQNFSKILIQPKLESEDE